MPDAPMRWYHLQTLKELWPMAQERSVMKSRSSATRLQRAEEDLEHLLRVTVRKIRLCVEDQGGKPLSLYLHWR